MADLVRINAWDNSNRNLWSAPGTPSAPTAMVTVADHGDEPHALIESVPFGKLRNGVSDEYNAGGQAQMTTERGSMALRVASVAFFFLLMACEPQVGHREGDPKRGHSGAVRPPATPLRLKASDGTTVFARIYEASRPKATILLFHQAGSSKDEYATIGPRLAAAGYTSLAVDQRSGDRMFGPNETAEAMGRNRPDPNGDAGFLQSLPDMQAALDWAVAQGRPVILWGSSYSASLIFKLAADRPRSIVALLAFSPGEYFPDPTLVRRAAFRLAVPALIANSGSAEERADSQGIVAAIRNGNATELTPRHGEHGSSLLITGRNPQGADDARRAVMRFLARVDPDPVR